MRFSRSSSSTSASKYSRAEGDTISTLEYHPGDPTHSRILLGRLGGELAFRSVPIAMQSWAAAQPGSNFRYFCG